jgi:hypothetical protein
LEDIVAQQLRFSPIDLLTVLANQSAVAVENAQWSMTLENKVTERTVELKQSNDRLEQRTAELTIINRVQEGLVKQLKYTTYATPLDYFVALRSGAVYAVPNTKAKKLLSFSPGARYTLLAQVQGTNGKSKWYQVSISGKNGTKTGYVKESAGKARGFRLDKMFKQVLELKAAADAPNTVYIKNYKNRNGKPPELVNGSPVDEIGYNRSQSAPAYLDKAKTSFTYVPDGMLGTKYESANGLTRVHFPSLGEDRWIPDKYMSTEKDAIATLTQVVVVDRKYQNSASFALQNGQWVLISMNYVSTGKSGGYALPTPLGDFMVQQKVSKFYYYKDGTKTIDGYAPYGVRFSGGGYLHGVPRKLGRTPKGKFIDPGHAESLRSLGTTPQSHMCVRNYTSYAKFTYDWIKIGSGSVIVFE